jgi:hypothetical protein
MPYDPLDRIKAFEEETTAALAQNEGWAKKQADQLEKDGWTDAAARARTQLTEAEEAKPTKAKESAKAEPKKTTTTTKKDEGK